MAFNPVNWLDIWNIFEFEIIGEYWLMVFIGAILLAYVCAKYDCPFQITIILMTFYGLILSSLKYGSDLLIYSFAVLVIGGISYYLLTKVFKRG